MKRACAMLVSLATLTACNPQIPKSTATLAPAPTPSSSAPIALKITAHGTAKRPIRIVQSDRSNRTQYDLLARSFESNGAQGNARATFAVPHVTFYGKDGSTLVADAPRAVLDQGANTVELDGGVTAHTGTGMKLQCDTLVYDRKSEMLHGTGNVVITDRNGFQAMGSKVDSDITLTHTQMQ